MYPCTLSFVAPFTGAWIEIVRRCFFPCPDGRSHPSRVRGLKYKHQRNAYQVPESHPSRVRGLKLPTRLSLVLAALVAPFTGAWIEMLFVMVLLSFFMSHPSRVRGLKLCFPWDMTRGSKVAPFTGAWIEMSTQKEHSALLCVAPFTGAWIEIDDFDSP